MNCSEQQINKQLNQAQEQQELNHIRWLLNKNTQQNFFIGKSKDQDISEWISHKEQTSQIHKKNLINYFKTKETQKSNRYTKLLDIIHQNDSKSFLNFAKLQTHKINKPKQKVPSPNRVNLKFSIPTFLQHYPTYSQELDIKKSSLPVIKKIIVPISFLRNNDKNDKYDKKEKKREANPEEQRKCRFLFREHSQSLWSSREKESVQSNRNGRLMATTKRVMKGFHSSNTKKEERKSLDSKKLQECITFLK